jgi:hypothetical protein
VTPHSWSNLNVQYRDPVPVCDTRGMSVYPFASVNSRRTWASRGKNAGWRWPALRPRQKERFREIKQPADPPPPSRIHLFHTWFLLVVECFSWLVMRGIPPMRRARMHTHGSRIKEGREKEKGGRKKGMETVGVWNLFIHWDAASLSAYKTERSFSRTHRRLTLKSTVARRNECQREIATRCNAEAATLRLRMIISEWFIPALRAGRFTHSRVYTRFTFSRVALDRAI